VSIHVECGQVRWASAQMQPVEMAVPLWSETVATAGTTANAAPEGAGDGAVVFTITAEVDVWVAIGATPAPGVAPRRRLKAGATRSFLAFSGAKVGWSAT